MTKKTDNYEDVLAGQIPEFTPQEEQLNEEQVEQQSDAASYLGQKLTHKIGKSNQKGTSEEEEEMIQHRGLSKIGENISLKNDIRDGWMEVDRRLLQERDIFYPEDWKFRIKPAQVEAIRNWSTIDDENPNSIDTVFNEIMKSCFGILTNSGPLPWSNIRSWDRLFFILMIKEYTFINGEAKVEFTEECPECGEEVTFNLESMSLSYDLPDNDVMKYYDREMCEWYIDPEKFDIEGFDPITLYLPTLEKDANIKAWMIDKLQNKKKIDESIVKFFPWLLKKVSRDLNIAQKQIREAELIVKSWDENMYSFMDGVIRNIMVTPAQYLTQVCPKCGEEVTSDIRFPNGVKSLFTLENRYKKFGSK